jgi:ABC-2 type transport system permease protein
MKKFWRSVWVITFRELTRVIQDKTRMISSFTMPLLFLVIFGAGFNRLISLPQIPGSEPIDFLQFMYPGIIGQTVLMTSIMSGLSIVWDREFGFLREVLVAPLSRSGIVAGKALGTAVMAILQGIIMLALAPLIGVELNLKIVLLLVPLLLLLSLSLSGLGLFIGSRMRSQQGFQMIVQLIIFPLIFLSGVFFPLTNVPGWMAFLSKINPVSYGIDAIRQLFLGNSLFAITVLGHTMSMLESALVVAVFGLIFMSLAVWAFNRQE